MADTTKMICPDCGALMNHHAMKLEYGTDDPAILDRIFGGVLKEVHTCPECGRAEMRTAA